MYGPAAHEKFRNPYIDPTQALSGEVRVSDQEALQDIKQKMKSKWGQDFVHPLHLHWEEIRKLRSRVDDVFSGLSKKIVKNHITNEVKKQLLSSKRLKGYFEEHVTEREAIEKSIAEEVEKN